MAMGGLQKIPNKFEDVFGVATAFFSSNNVAFWRFNVWRKWNHQLQRLESHTVSQSVSQSERSESLNHQSRELLASEYCSNTFRSIYAGFGSFMLHSEAQITSTTNKHRLLFDRRFAIIAPLLTITDEAQIMLRIDQNRPFEVIKSK